MTIKTALLAVAAATALLGAALMAVPSAHEGLELCFHPLERLGLCHPFP